MTLSDIVITTALILLVPRFVEKYLSAVGFSRELRMMVAIGALVWILFSCNFGITGSDANSLWDMGKGWAERLGSKDYTSVVSGLLGGGNSSYSAFVGILQYGFNISKTSMLALNAFMAFWGSLTLVRTIYLCNFVRASKEVVLPLFLIFTPSVVYWSSSNLKAGMLYWAVCQILAFMAPWESRKEFWHVFSLFLLGGFVGMLLRPHTALIWFVTVLVVKMIIQRRLIKYGICIILLAFLYDSHIHKIETHVNFSSFKETIHNAEFLMGGLIRRGKPSTFDYGEGGPIPVVSGAVNAFFRPFIWRPHKLTALLSSLEIWTISLGILFLWGRMTKREWKLMVRDPVIQVSILVLIPFSFLFTYFPNEGLISRQRLQLIPALLVLFSTPILQRWAHREKVEGPKSDTVLEVQTCFLSPGQDTQ